MEQPPELFVLMGNFTSQAGDTTDGTGTVPLRFSRQLKVSGSLRGDGPHMRGRGTGGGASCTLLATDYCRGADQSRSEWQWQG